MKKKIGIGLLIVLVGIQFVMIDKENPEVDESKDFITITAPPAEAEHILRVACYDCHSNETAYPWYSNIAPVSWWLKSHIDEGREHLNFSVWGEYETKRATHKLDECVEMVEEGKMPLDSYTWTHGDADLSDADRELLVEWFKKEMEDVE